MSKTKLNCLNCSSDFLRATWDVKRGRTKFCSRNCSFKYHKGENSNTYKGGWTSSHGYKKQMVEGKEVYEHRMVVERGLGRKLESHEDVHHIDGNKLNNDPNNLVVLSKREHTIIHDRVGEKNNKAKLTGDQVIHLRKLHDQGLNYERLAEYFNIDPSNASLIVKRKTWKHI